MLNAVWMLGRSELRRRWAGVFVLVLIVGLAGTVVLATAAGARRSGSAFARFNAESRPADSQILTGHGTTTAQLDAFQRAVAGIAEVEVLNVYVLAPAARPDKLIAAETDRTFGTVFDRSRLIAGRYANPDAPDEIAVSESFATQMHVRQGSVVPTVSLTPSQFQVALNGGDPGPSLGLRINLHVVGIVRSPLDLGDRGTVGGTLVLTSAFNQRYGRSVALFSPVLRVRVADPHANLARVEDLARSTFGKNPFATVQPTASDSRGAQDAIDVLTLALWVFAGLAALAALVALTVVLSREFARGRAEQEALRTLGMTRRERVCVALPRALTVAVGGALVGVLGAVTASPLFPIGVARRAEPSPGVDVDWTVVALGFVAIVAVVLAIAWIATFRNVELATSQHRAGGRHRAAVYEVAVNAGVRPTVSNGMRMALQPGRGEGAVPLRSAFLGIVFGVTGIVAVVVFSASLRHLVATPRLYGQTWDFEVTDNAGESATVCSHTDFGLQRVKGVGAVSDICTETSTIDGRATNVWGMTLLRGDVGPAIAAGRGPATSDEIALGAETLRALHVKIGDAVTVHGPKSSPAYRVVGQAVFSNLSDSDPQPLADGAVLSEAGFNRIIDTSNMSRYLVARFSGAGDRRATEAAINALPFSPQDSAVFDIPPTYAPVVPAEISRLRNIDWFPATGAILLALLALVAIAHALVVAVRRRQYDLALLKTLGFDRAQIRATVAWQAITLGAVGLVIGVPAGVLVGATAWRAVAHEVGVASVPVLPWALVLAVPVVLAVVVGLSLLPGRSAARIHPAAALAAANAS